MSIKKQIKATRATFIIPLFVLTTIIFTAVAVLSCPVCCSAAGRAENDSSLWQQTLQKISEFTAQINSEEDSPEISIVIDTINRTLTVFADGQMSKQYACANGKPQTPTPVGTWQVAHKAVNWGTGFGTRWLGLNVSWGTFGIHGTNKPGSIGSYASHGCIRMNNTNVEELYPQIPVGTPVYIIGNPFGVYGEHDNIVQNSRGADVVELERILKKYGYYNGSLDGISGYQLTQAICSYRQEHGLSKNNQADRELYDALGL